MLLNEVEAKAMLKNAKINVNDTRLATTCEEAIKIHRELGFPIVLKIVSPDIVHKSDSGGVKLNIETEEQARRAYNEIISAAKNTCPTADIRGVSVQKMAPNGVEVIIGVSRDEQFGPVIMFGLGGIWVEVLKDVSFRVLPINRSDAAEMIREIKGFKLLTKFRGQPAVDISALENMLLAVSEFVETHPDVEELDLNPVFAYPHSALAVDARIVIKDGHSSSIKREKQAKPPASLDFLFYPKSVAVVGASNNPNSLGYNFISNLINFNYSGKIYPISRKDPEIMGIKAYPHLNDVPDNVDHVIYCIALENMPEFLGSCAQKGVKSIHIFSARGSETGRAESKTLEVEISKQAKKHGIRLLGPNCMGIYCPESGFSFCTDFPKEKGNVGAIIQSGGSSTDITKFGALRGLRFSKVISYGNALDINEMDLLNYLANDPETRIIISFVEGLKSNGREFLDLVRKTSKTKPFIICKGGKSRAGARCTMSHTASLAGSSQIWDTAIRQAGGILARDIDDLIHMAVGFSYILPIKGRRVGTGGSGGGRNTVSADEWEDNGFEVVPLPQEIREEFKKRGAQLWDCLDNPADRSIQIPGDAYTTAALFLEMAKHPDFDFICANVAAEDHPYNKETFTWIADNVEGYIKLYKANLKPAFLIFSDRPMGITDMEHWFWREVAQLRTRLVAEKVPFFPSVDKSAEVVNALINYYKRRESG